MPGANLSGKNRMRLRQQFWKYLAQSTAAGGPRSLNKLGRDRMAVYPTFLYKAGIPASNTAADAPDRKNQICIDVTNKDVYLCTAYTNNTTFTWLKISD